MKLIKQLLNLREEKTTYTYHFRMNDDALDMNPPMYTPHGVNGHELTDDVTLDGEEANKKFTDTLRKYMLGDSATTKAGIELLDAFVTKYHVDVYQYIKDSDVEDGFDIADLYDGDDDDAAGELKNRTKAKPMEPTLGDAMDSGGAGTFSYMIEFVVVSTTPLTQKQGQVIVNQVGGYAWGQYWSMGLNGTEDWEMTEI